MKNKNYFFSGSANHSRKNFIVFCFISLFVHVLFFIGFLGLQTLELSKPLPRVVQVDLVSFVPGPASGQGDVSPSPDPMPEPESVFTPEPAEIPLDTDKVPMPEPMPEPEKTVPEPVARLKPDISLKAKPKNLKELMAAQKEKEKIEKEKKTATKKPARKLKAKVNPEAALKKAREKMEKKIEEENRKQISEALKRMQSAIKKKQEADARSVQENSRDDGLGPGAGTGTGMGKQGYDPIDLYKMKIQFAIEQNWVFNDMLAKMDQNLEVRILIKILKSGEIRDTTYETRSGNRYLDESAKKAIKKANPLPELPKGMKSYDVVVIFTPKGLK